MAPSATRYGEPGAPRGTILPAIVVYQQGGGPGPGFYELAVRLDLYAGGKDEVARLSFFVGELKRVYAYWRKH